jgi:hypothetical protein
MAAVFGQWGVVARGQTQSWGGQWMGRRGPWRSGEAQQGSEAAIDGKVASRRRKSASRDTLEKFLTW